MPYTDLELIAEEELGFAAGGNVASSRTSIAWRQAKHDSPILPIGAEAFEPGHYNLMLILLQHDHKHNSFSDFYASLGITITEESELTGWAKCQLPEGWRVSYDDTPDPSHDESVHYLMPDGTEAFYLISYKNSDSRITTISISNNLSAKA